jgi:hypothetical protein
MDGSSQKMRYIADLTAGHDSCLADQYNLIQREEEREMYPSP